jgi:hypothetical protein
MERSLILTIVNREDSMTKKVVGTGNYETAAVLAGRQTRNPVTKHIPDFQPAGPGRERENVEILQGSPDTDAAALFTD